MDAAYFRSAFDAWLDCGSRFRRVQRELALSLGALAYGLLLTSDHRLQLAGGAVALVAVIEFVEFFAYRRRWIAQRLAARPSVTVEAHVLFDEEGASLDGPHSESRCRWAAFRGVAESRHGLRIALGDGMVVFLPRPAIQPESAIPEIVRRIRSASVR